MRTIYLVSCVSKKLGRSCAAKDMYQSDWFKKARAYVEAAEAPWYILSAKYGLLSPDESIAPYEKTLNTMPIGERRLWAGGVLKQLRPLLSPKDEVQFLAGARYREFLESELGGLVARVDVPMEGMRIGEQLSWLGRRHVAVR